MKKLIQIIMNDFDTIVIGAGIVGSATAFQLAKRGQRVFLLDQFPLPHTRGMSHGTTRLFHHISTYQVYTDIRNKSLKHWRELEARTGQKLLTQTGFMWTGEKRLGTVREMYDHMTKNKIPCEMWSAYELTRRFPQLHSMYADDDFETLYDPGAGLLAANKCLLAFQNEFIKLGGVLHDGEQLLSLNVSPNRVHIKTNKQSHTANSVALCMGAWAGQFMKHHLGLDLRLQPLMVKLCFWKTNTDAYNIENDFPCMYTWTKDGDKFFGAPCGEYPGLMKLYERNGVPCDPDTRDIVSSTAQQSLITSAQQHIKQSMHGLQPTPALVETCMYMVSESDLPFIDRHPIHSNVVIAAGFSGQGFKWSPVAAEIISDLVQDIQPKYDIDLFKIQSDNIMRTQSKL